MVIVLVLVYIVINIKKGDKMGKINLLIRLSKIKHIGNIFDVMLKIIGLDIGKNAQIGRNVNFEHRGMGTVIGNSAIIDDNVTIYHNVTIGRADVHIKSENMKGIHLKNNAIICAGAKILCKNGTLTVGENSIIASNAVLLESTGDNEIWGGIPAKKIGIRKDIVSL